MRRIQDDAGRGGRTRRLGGKQPAGWVREVLGALLALVCVVPAGAAETASGPGRIAVTGAYPTGYVGLLARNGLSREILLDYQLSDPETLSRYDLIIIAGFSPGALVPQRFPAFGERPVLGALDAIDRFVAQGGSLLLDYSGSAGPAMAWFAGRRAGKPASAAMQRTTARFRLTPGDNPLLPDISRDESLPSTVVGYVPTPENSERAVVLAEYLQPMGKLPRKATRGVGGGADEPQAPAGSPAIVLESRGKGKVIQCGASVGVGIALAGIDYDRLVMAMVRLLTSGRATPQLIPEGSRLGRKQTGRTAAERGADPAAEETPPTPVIPDRPDGPGARGALPKGFSPVEEEPATEYNLHGTLQGSQAEVLLNYWNSANHLRVGLGSSGIRVTHVSGGHSRGLSYTKTAVAKGTPVVIKERHRRLIVVAGSASATVSISNLHRGSAASSGALGELRYQPVEPALFSDDFMRTSDEPGGWETRGGTWRTAPVQNPDMGANPFSYKVSAEAEPATAIAGYPYWDEYRFTASVRPETVGGQVGMGFYAQDPDNMLLFRARIQETGPLEDGFSLVRMVDGRPQVLAQRPGGLRACQWYRVQVKAEGPWIGAFVDGERVLAVRETTFPGGQIALRAERTSARFDDVLVEPVTTTVDSGQRLVGRVPAWAGIIDVDSWAGPATPWEAHPEMPGFFWRRGAFYGDVGMRFEIPALPPGGQAMLLADGNGESPESGYALTLSRGGTATAVALAHGGKVLARASVPNQDPVTLSLRKQGNRVLGLVDGSAVVQMPSAPAAGLGRLAFQALGFKPRISAIAVWSANIGDYTFDSAPVDWWVASGEWDVTNRWSCTPDWSWFGGYSPNVAAVWHKRPFEGNIVLDFYAGPKMITEGQRKKEAMADFNAALCGDGTSINSGYSFVVAENGVGARILKHGQVAAENKAFRFFSRGHNRWANIRVEKHGARLRLFAEGQLAVEYKDPQPLTGGYAGVWTQNNGIMMPRVTLYYEALGKQILSLPQQG